MKDYLRDRLEMVGIDKSTIDQYDARMAEGELTDRDIARFVKLFEVADQESVYDTLREIREDAEKIPVNSEGWNDVRKRLGETIQQNRDEQLKREQTVAKAKKILAEVTERYNELFPPKSIDSVKKIFDACDIPREKFDAMRVVLAPLEQNPPQHVDIDKVEKMCDVLEIGTKKTLINYLTPSNGLYGHEMRKSLEVEMKEQKRVILDEKSKIDDLAKQADALSLMHSYARSKQNQLIAAEYLVTVAEPAREFLGRQHERFQDVAKDTMEYAQDVIDRIKDVPKHMAYGSIAERLRLSDAKFTPVIDAMERHHAKSVSKNIGRYEEAIKDREDFVKKKAAKEEERLRAKFRRDIEKWYRDESRGKPKEERDELRQQKENLIKGREMAIPDEARRTVEDSHKRILAKMDKVIDKHRESYEHSIQWVAQDIVNIRHRAADEREHLDSLLREGKISDKQYDKYIEQIDKIDYNEEQRFSKDVKKFLEQDKGNLGRTMLEEKIDDIEQQYEAEMTENGESIEQVVEQGEPVVENDVQVQDVNDVVIEEPDESLSQDEPDVVQEEESVIWDDGEMVFTPEETGFSLDQIIDSEDQEFVPAEEELDEPKHEEDEFEWVNGYEIE